MSSPQPSTLICTRDDIPAGQVRGYVVDGIRLAVVHTEDGGFHAVSDQCSHERVPLSEGEVDGCCLECPRHSSLFDLRTGRPMNLPATAPVRVYPVEIRGNDVYVVFNAPEGVNSEYSGDT